MAGARTVSEAGRGRARSAGVVRGWPSGWSGSAGRVDLKPQDWAPTDPLIRQCLGTCSRITRAGEELQHGLRNAPGRRAEGAGAPRSPTAMQAEQHQPETAKRHDSPFEKIQNCFVRLILSGVSVGFAGGASQETQRKKNVRTEEISVPLLAGDCGVGLSVEAIQAGLRDELHELSRGTTAEGPGKRCGVSHQDLTLKKIVRSVSRGLAP